MLRSLFVVWICLSLVLFPTACLGRQTHIILLVDNETLIFDTNLDEVGSILNQAQVLLGPEDRVIYLGDAISPAASIPQASTVTLTVRRAVTLIILAPETEPREILSSAQTVGQALLEAGFELHPTDRLDPPFGAPITGDLTITWQPGVDLAILVDDTVHRVRSAASTVGSALADAGFPLIGLDYSLPAETQPLPEDGQIKIVRVREEVALTLKSIPYGTRTELSTDLEIDQRALLQAGEPGLAISRLRTRQEDGTQVAQLNESESLVRAPQDEVLGIGTKIVIRNTVVDGVEIEYWRALTLFATYYVPCGPPQPKCYYYTSIGTPVQKGAVAMVYPWFLLFAHENLYVPGYGFATVEDTNGAATTSVGTYWIDLGFSMEEEITWTENRYVTVYFLTPVPANVADTYILP